MKIHLKAVVKLRDDVSCQPENLFVGIGPAICSHCYHGKIELLKTVLTDYQGLGLRRENIEIAGACTFENSSAD